MFDLTGKALANRVRAAGLGDGFSRPSGRIGMARRMVAAGAPNAAVRRQGRWKHGDMVDRYTRGEAAGEAPQVADLTYTTPTRCKHPVRHSWGRAGNLR